LVTLSVILMTQMNGAGFLLPEKCCLPRQRMPQCGETTIRTLRFSKISLALMECTHLTAAIHIFQCSTQPIMPDFLFLNRPGGSKQTLRVPTNGKLDFFIIPCIHLRKTTSEDLITSKRHLNRYFFREM